MFVVKEDFNLLRNDTQTSLINVKKTIQQNQVELSERDEKIHNRFQLVLWEAEFEEQKKKLATKDMIQQLKEEVSKLAVEQEVQRMLGELDKHCQQMQGQIDNDLATRKEAKKLLVQIQEVDQRVQENSDKDAERDVKITKS